MNYYQKEYMSVDLYVLIEYIFSDLIIHRQLMISKF